MFTFKPSITSGHSVQPEAYTYKVVLVGPAMAGKTCLCCRWVSDCWIDDPSATLGAAYSLLRVTLPCSPQAEEQAQREAQRGTQSEVELQLWDTAGQELYRCLTPLYLRGCDAAVIVLDSSTSSMKNLKQDLEDWLALTQQASPSCLLFFALAKVDLVSSESVESLLSELRAYDPTPTRQRLHATSSKLGTGCSNLLESVVWELEKNRAQRVNTQIKAHTQCEKPKTALKEDGRVERCC